MVLLSSSPQWLPICLGVKTHILTMAYKALRGLPWPSVPPVTGLACAAHPLHSSCSGFFAISHSCQACSLCLNALSTVVYKVPSHAPAGFLLNVALSLSQGDLPLSSTLPALPSGAPPTLPLICFSLSLWPPRDSVSTSFIVLLIPGWCKLHGRRDFCQFCSLSRIPFGP